MSCRLDFPTIKSQIFCVVVVVVFLNDTSQSTSDVNGACIVTSSIILLTPYHILNIKTWEVDSPAHGEFTRNEKPSISLNIVRDVVQHWRKKDRVSFRLAKENQRRQRKKSFKKDWAVKLATKASTTIRMNGWKMKTTKKASRSR